MPRKFEIKQPERCKSCDKADKCDFLTHLFQKPFDASGVLLDCKAFYIVFCDLEERCKIPFDDPEKLRQYDEEAEAGKHPFLTPALVTNGVLAAELALKALTLKETGTFDCIHDLDKLFYSLPDVHKNALSATIKEKAHQNDAMHMPRIPAGRSKQSFTAGWRRVSAVRVLRRMASWLPK